MEFFSRRARETAQKFASTMNKRANKRYRVKIIPVCRPPTAELNCIFEKFLTKDGVRLKKLKINGNPVCTS